MSPVTVVGMVAGGLLIVTACAVFLNKKEFPAGGLGVALVGLVLIGMSQWTSIKVNTPGGSVEFAALQKDVKQTAEAADELATQAQETAASVETTRQQVTALTQQLQNNKVLTATAVAPIRAKLETAPRADVSRLRIAKDNLSRVTNR